MRNNEYRVWVTGDEHAKDGFYYINFGNWISEFARRTLNIKIYLKWIKSKSPKGGEEADKETILRLP